MLGRIYMLVCRYLCAYMSVRIHISVEIHMCYMHARLHMFVWMLVCMYVRCVCVCKVCVYVRCVCNTYTHTHAHFGQWYGIKRSCVCM